MNKAFLSLICLFLCLSNAKAGLILWPYYASGTYPSSLTDIALPNGEQIGYATSAQQMGLRLALSGKRLFFGIQYGVNSAELSFDSLPANYLEVNQELSGNSLGVIMDLYPGKKRRRKKGQFYYWLAYNFSDSLTDQSGIDKDSTYTGSSFELAMGWALMKSFLLSLGYKSASYEIDTRQISGDSSITYQQLQSLGISQVFVELSFPLHLF